MADDEEAAGRPVPAGQTVQLDALSDVELVDNEPERDEEPPLDAPVVSRAPPPLPKRRSPVPMVLGFVGVVVLGGLGAFGAQYLLPAPAPPPAPAPAPAPPPVASPPPVAEAEPPPEVRHVRLDEFVIGAPDPDAGTPAP